MHAFIYRFLLSFVGCLLRNESSYAPAIHLIRFVSISLSLSPLRFQLKFRQSVFNPKNQTEPHMWPIIIGLSPAPPHAPRPEPVALAGRQTATQSTFLLLAPAPANPITLIVCPGPGFGRALPIQSCNPLPVGPTCRLFCNANLFAFICLL